MTAQGHLARAAMALHRAIPKREAFDRPGPGDGQPQIGAVCATPRGARRTRTYREDQTGRHFLRNHGHSEPTGPCGQVALQTPPGFVARWGAGRPDAWHRHVAMGAFVCLAGEARCLAEGRGPVALRQGKALCLAAHQPHAVTPEDQSIPCAMSRAVSRAMSRVMPRVMPCIWVRGWPGRCARDERMKIIHASRLQDKLSPTGGRQDQGAGKSAQVEAADAVGGKVVADQTRRARACPLAGMAWSGRVQQTVAPAGPVGPASRRDASGGQIVVKRGGRRTPTDEMVLK